MNKDLVRELLDGVRRGEVSVDEAIGRLAGFDYLDLGHTKVDTHRALRTGFPEVVFAEGKTPGQVAEIMAHIAQASPESPVLATRASAAAFEATQRVCGEAEYSEVARCIVVDKSRLKRKASYDGSYIAVICAGTSDIPVAEEAVLTAEVMGNRVERVYDVGVAGLHRLIRHADTIRKASCLIVVAGMEGALASVVGGLVDRPVIGVPTSVGYGASFGGIAALLSMLNACASGIAVVNIDNGFGAACFANMVNE